MEKSSQPPQWRFNLEKTNMTGSIKEPMGSKQEIVEVNVRASSKSNTTMTDVLEAVRPDPCSRNSFIARLELREVSYHLGADDVVYFLDDGERYQHLHDHVHDQLRHEPFQVHFQHAAGLRAI